MRPVNLIPPEQQRGERAPLRRGIAAYAIVGVLAVALVAVTALIMTSNQVSEREAEVAALEAREAQVTAEATALAPYAEFAAMQLAREATITSLASSRFDWERVMRELAIVLPPKVTLTELSGSVAPSVSIGGGGELRAQSEGPALALLGCAPGQETVANLVSALEDIDGVTRVGVSTSERDLSEPAGTDPGAVPEVAVPGDTGEGNCAPQQRYTFDITAVFDAVAVPATPSAATPEVPATPAAGTTPAPAGDVATTPPAATPPATPPATSTPVEAP